MMNKNNFSPASQNIQLRNNIHISGKGEQTIILAHGFGCNQNMWRFILPALEDKFNVVLFDYVGSGQSQLFEYSKTRYQSLEGYAQDIIDICDALALQNVIFAGHSVSATIGAIVSQQRPELFSEMIMVCPSPCFLNFTDEYQGGFNKDDLEELINLMDKNYIGWASYLAPLVMGQSHSESMISELSDSFCSTDPKYSKPFAKATFFSDYRSILPKTTLPCLILQSAQDSLAAVEIGQYMEQQIPDSTLAVINATGHCLHMTEPELVLKAMFSFLNNQGY